MCLFWCPAPNENLNEGKVVSSKTIEGPSVPGEAEIAYTDTETETVRYREVAQPSGSVTLEGEATTSETGSVTFQTYNGTAQSNDSGQRDHPESIQHPDRLQRRL